MILCDIGNTNYHFYIDGKVFDEKELSIKNREIYYISVNDEKEKILKKKNSAISLNKMVKFDTSYQGLGVDRIMACKTIKSGIVVDAGSAITIDIMSEGIHLGGTILPGISTYIESYKSISDKLDTTFNMNIDFKVLPNSTREAISFGAIGSIVFMIDNLSRGNKIYFTGGDGQYLSKFFKNSIYIKNLVFDGMKQTIKELKI
jgi:type III pantothenate kinase